jgi:hypothetical protein
LPFTVALLAIIVVLLWDRIVRTAERPGRITDNISNRLLELARLAHTAYCSSRRQNGRIYLVADNGMAPGLRLDGENYEILDTINHDAIWLLRNVRQNNGRSRYLLLFRGTHVPQDLVTDYNLAKLVARNDEDEFREQMANPLNNAVQRLLARHDVGQDATIIAIGHSLGATLAETILVMLAGTYANLSAVCFDSPGTPVAFRQGHDAMFDERLTVVNSVANVVNMLSRPATRQFYVVSSGAHWTPGYLLTTARAIYSWQGAFNAALGSHSIEFIVEHLRSGDFREGDVDNWPTWSANVLARLDRNDGPELEEVNRPAPGGAEEETVAPGGAQHHGNEQARAEAPHPVALPRDTADAVVNVPYRIDDDPNNPNDNLAETLIAHVPAADAIIAVCGITAAGKTAMIQALADLRGNIVGLNVNADEFEAQRPVLVLLAEATDDSPRVWLLDTPGIVPENRDDGNAAAAGWRANDFAGQLEDLAAGRVQMVVHVIGGVCTPTDVAMYRTAMRVVGGRVVVVHNEFDNDGEENLVTATATTARTLGIAPAEVHRIRVARPNTQQPVDTERGVAELRNRLLGFAADNLRAAQEANFERAERERERDRRERNTARREHVFNNTIIGNYTPKFFSDRVYRLNDTFRWPKVITLPATGVAGVCALGAAAAGAVAAAPIAAATAVAGGAAVAGFSAFSNYKHTTLTEAFDNAHPRQ